MANKSQGTWYVSFELPRGKRALARATETFPNEREAKKFARAKLVDTPNVTAGTLNPHLPKRTIATTQMLEWLERTGRAGCTQVTVRIGASGSWRAIGEGQCRIYFGQHCLPWACSAQALAGAYFPSTYPRINSRLRSL